MTLTLCTAGGEMHGLINTLTNSVVYDEFKYMKPEYKTQIEKEKKEDARLVEVQYTNSRGRHERLTKPYCRYAGDPILMYNFIPGHTYKIPLGLVKEVNDKRVVQRSGLLEVDGKGITASGAPLDKDTEIDNIHRFISTKF